jgi:amidase
MSQADALLALPAVELRRRIGTKDLSPMELLEAAIERIAALNPAVNAAAATGYEARAAKQRLRRQPSCGAILWALCMACRPASRTCRRLRAC